MNNGFLTNILLVYKKELLDIIRDRRTLISMIVVPIVLFPLITIGFSTLAMKQQESLESQQYDVGVLHGESWPELFKKISEADHLQVTDFDEDSVMVDSLLRRSDLRIVAVFPQHRSESDTTSFDVKLMVDESKEQSRIAMEKLIDRLEEFKSEESERRLRILKAPVTILKPVTWEKVNIASSEQMLGMILGLILPYMMIILTMSGGMYPAIDLTAGEKERSTLETLLVTPVGRIDIVLGKFFTVMTTSLVTALISMTTMSAVMAFGMAGMIDQTSDIAFTINPLYLLLAILMIIPMTALFSSLLITIAIMAKSTREAQSYISPLFIAVMLPAMMSMLPGSTLTAKHAWIPVVNIALAIKDILMSQPRIDYILIVIISTTIYAAIGIFISMRVFQREQVLFKV